MPAYGNALNPSETKALVAFLETLRGHDLAPATDASRTLANASAMQTPASREMPKSGTP